MPCQWTDHPESGAPSHKIYTGERATPNALRDLIEVICGLAHRSASSNADAIDGQQGGTDDPAAASLRTSADEADEQDLATTRAQEQAADHHPSGSDGPGNGDKKPEGRNGGRR